MAVNRVTVTNQVQFQTALNNAATQPISYIDVEVDKIVLTSPLILPKTLGSPSGQLVINGAGCTLEPAQANAMIYLMKVFSPSSEQEANNMLANRFIIRDLNFNGRSGNIIALELSATYGSEIHNCKFTSNATSVKLMYAPGTRIVNCISSFASAIAFDINKGTYVNPPANPKNNAFGSSHTRLEQCRVINNPGAYAACNIIASQNVVLDQFVSERNGPNYHVYFDSSYFANNIVLNNLYLETSATVAGIKLKLYGGYAKISNITHYTNQVLVDAESQKDYPKVYVEYMPNLTAGTTFRTGGLCGASDVVWSFFEIPNGDEIFSPTRWESGNVPVYRYSEYFIPSKGIVTNYMKVNNNVISA